MDVIVSVKNRIRIKACPLTIGVRILSCRKTLILKTGELGVLVMEFLRMVLVDEETRREKTYRYHSVARTRALLEDHLVRARR